MYVSANGTPLQFNTLILRDGHGSNCHKEVIFHSHERRPIFVLVDPPNRSFWGA